MKIIQFLVLAVAVILIPLAATAQKASTEKESPSGSSYTVIKAGDDTQKPVDGQEVEIHVVVKDAEGTQQWSTHDMGFTNFYTLGTAKTDDEKNMEIDLKLMGKGAIYSFKVPNKSEEGDDKAPASSYAFYEVELVDFGAPAKSAANLLAEIANTDGIEAAAVKAEMLRKDDSEGYAFREGEINAKGYQFLEEKKYAEALAFFNLNVSLFPESHNVYDSRGDAFLAKGDTENAKANFAKAVELNPQCTYCQTKLDQLTSGAGEKE
ncbi:MAG: hypothetical protein KDC30_05785 [Saprospiraceae bacterium]|nr:hypothetical protein [Saprospiraceae bacterium]